MNVYGLGDFFHLKRRILIISNLIDLRTTIMNKLLSLLLATLAFCSFPVSAEPVDRDTVFIDSLNVRFNLDDPVIKSGVIDFYIDSIGVASNDFLKFITLVATPYDFSKPQINRIFDTASTQYNETRILTYLKYFNDKSYIPIVKEWFVKSDKRAKSLYESILFEFGDKEISDQWENNMRGCSTVNKMIPMSIGQYLPVICGRFPDRRFCDCVLDFVINHQNQYFVYKDYNGDIEYDDVVYFISFFLVDRLKGFPDAFAFNKYVRNIGKNRYVSFTQADKDRIIKWCKLHRRDYEFEY